MQHGAKVYLDWSGAGNKYTVVIDGNEGFALSLTYEDALIVMRQLTELFRQLTERAPDAIPNTGTREQIGDTVVTFEGLGWVGAITP